jgi:surface protein
MFYGASAFNADISGWDTSSATNIGTMFQHASAFNADISGWDTSSATNIGTMFQHASAFNADISGWDTSSVTNMEKMFWGASAFNADILGWDTSSVTDVDRMFYGAATWLAMYARRFNTASFDGPPSAWYDARTPFNRTGLLSAIDACLAVDPTGVYCCSAGADCGVARTLEMPYWDVSGITNMASLFYNQRQLNDGSGGTLDSTQFNADISRWDLSSAISIWGTFRQAKGFNQDISGWNTGNVNNFANAFEGAEAFNQNISLWNTGQVTRIEAMFRGAVSFNQDISGWDTSKVATMQEAFKGATAFDYDITGWDTGLVTNAVNMFFGATAWLATYERKDGTASYDGPPTAWHIPPCTCCQEKMMSMGLSTGRQCIPQP